MRDHRTLAVYPKAHALGLFVYRVVTPALPRTERFGLIPQIQRSARSIPSNLLEGCGRYTNPDFAHFVDISTGSGNELRYWAILCRDLEYLPAEIADELEQRVVEIIRMLVALARNARSTPTLEPRLKSRSQPVRKQSPERPGPVPDESS